MLCVTLIKRRNYFLFCFFILPCKSLMENHAFPKLDLVKKATTNENVIQSMAVHIIINPMINLKPF